MFDYFGSMQAVVFHKVTEKAVVLRHVWVLFHQDTNFKFPLPCFVVLAKNYECRISTQKAVIKANYREKNTKKNNLKNSPKHK